MRTGTKAEMFVLGPVDHELVRAIEAPRVAVRRCKAKPDHIAFLHRTAVEVDVPITYRPSCNNSVYRRKNSSTASGMSSGSGNEQRRGFRVCGEVVEHIAERTAGGVQPGDHDRESEGDDIGIGERLAIDAARQQVRHEIAGGLRGLAMRSSTIVRSTPCPRRLWPPFPPGRRRRSPEHALDERQQIFAVFEGKAE